MRYLFLALLCAPLVALGQGRAFSDTCTPGGLLFCSASGTYGASDAGASSQCLVSSGSGVPTWGSCGPTSTSSTPSTPSSGATSYNFMLDAGWPGIPYTIDSFMGIPTPTGTFGAYFTYYSTSTAWTTGCVFPAGWSGGTNVLLNQSTPGTSGSASSDAWSSASFLGRLKNNTYSTPGAINNGAAIKNNTLLQNVWRGNTANAGGWLWWSRVSLKNTNTNTRHAHGLFNRTSVLVANADPNAETNSVYFGCNQGDTNFSICSNDNAGTATCTTLGASFPCTTDGAAYDFWLTAAPNASVINYYVERLDSAAVATGALGSDLPQSTVQMNWHDWINTGSNVEVIILQFYGTCIASNL